MSIHFSPYALVIRKEPLDMFYPGGSEVFKAKVGCPYSTASDHAMVVQIGISHESIKEICGELDELGLQPAKHVDNQLTFVDFAIVNLQTMKTILPCPWLEVSDYEFSAIS